MMVLFVAAHESEVGPSRHLLGLHENGRYWREADFAELYECAR